MGAENYQLLSADEIRRNFVQYYGHLCMMQNLYSKISRVTIFIVQCILTKNIFGGHNTLNGGIIGWFYPLYRALGENINHHSCWWGMVYHQWLTWKLYIQYIPRNMHTVFVLLCFVVVIHWLISPYPTGLLHWHCGNLTISGQTTLGEVMVNILVFDLFSFLLPTFFISRKVIQG